MDVRDSAGVDDEELPLGEEAGFQGEGSLAGGWGGGTSWVQGEVCGGTRSCRS